MIHINELTTKRTYMIILLFTLYNFYWLLRNTKQTFVYSFVVHLHSFTFIHAFVQLMCVHIYSNEKCTFTAGLAVQRQKLRVAGSRVSQHCNFENVRKC